MDYDLVVIGAGPGGHTAAEYASRLGARVAIVEKDKWGGVCTHCGCIPTKALLECSKKYVDIKKLKRIGIAVGEPSFDFSVMKRHQNQMVRVSSLGVRKTLKETGVECIEGEGILVSPEDVEVVASDGKKKKNQVKAYRHCLGIKARHVAERGVFKSRPEFGRVAFHGHVAREHNRRGRRRHRS